MNVQTIRRDVLVLGGGLITTAAVAALLRAMSEVNPTTAALAMLLVVLAVATVGRLWIAALVAVVGMLTLNFLFIPPVGTFTIADPQNWVALFAFLVVAVIASNLSAAAHARTREAIARRHEVTRLFDLTRDVLLTTETAGAIDSVARHVARRCELSRVAVCLPSELGWDVHQGGEEEVQVEPGALDIAMAKARGALEFDARRRAYGGHTQVGTDVDAVSIVPLRHGTKAVGLLAAVAPGLELGSLDAVAGVVAIAIERAQFLGERDAAELVRQKADLAGTLLASLSHDLKTPLTAIRVALENLGEVMTEDERRDQARLAILEVDRLTHLFQDILDMARIDAAAISLDRQWFTPADVVDAAAAHVRHALAGRLVRVDADSDREVQLDPRLSAVALAHLIENAVKYSPVDREIAVVARGTADGLFVSVTDGGAGLDPGELDHLFERFYRGRAARAASPGTGMGLAITRGLLAAAGGRVWAENVPDSGARFSMVVPGPMRPVSIED